VADIANATFFRTIEDCSGNFVEVFASGFWAQIWCAYWIFLTRVLGSNTSLPFITFSNTSARRFDFVFLSRIFVRKLLWSEWTNHITKCIVVWKKITRWYVAHLGVGCVVSAAVAVR
jgi:hypothetical protein